MSADPRKLLRVTRRVTLVLAVLGTAYLFWRYQLLRLPDGSCSPLLRYSAGAQLIVDQRPGEYAVGDAVFFEGPDERVYLGAIERLEPSGVRIGTDNEACPGQGSDEFGVLPRSALRGRVILSLSL